MKAWELQDGQAVAGSFAIAADDVRPSHHSGAPHAKGARIFSTGIKHVNHAALSDESDPFERPVADP
jgi:hypothetical protein